MGNDIETGRREWQGEKYSAKSPSFNNLEVHRNKIKPFLCTVLTYHLVPRAIWPYYVKWNFSTFCGLSRSTTYPYLPQGRIGPLDPHSYPQGGVQIYPMANLLHKMWKQKYPPPNSDFWKNLTLAWFWPIIWHISNPEPPDTEIWTIKVYN